MKWINLTLSLIAIAVSIYFSYVTTQLAAIANQQTSDALKKTDVTEIATIAERMRQVRIDINNMNNSTKELTNKVNSLDKQIAVIEERLKNSTTKSLMAAGATKAQALQFWESPSTYTPPNFMLQNKAHIKK